MNDLRLNTIPVLAPFWQHTLNSNEPADRFNHLSYVSEIIIKALATHCYAKLLALDEDPGEVLEHVRDHFALPSIGDWSQLFRLSRKALAGRSDAWATALNASLDAKLALPPWIAVMNFTRKLQGLPPEGKTSLKVGEFLSLLVELRNRTRGHGFPRAQHYAEVNEPLSLSFPPLVNALDKHLNQAYYYVNDVVLDPDTDKDPDSVLVLGLRFQGLLSEPFQERCSRTEAPHRGRLYAKGITSPVYHCLDPLIKWDKIGSRFLVYNSHPNKDRIEYLACDSGNQTHLQGALFQEFFGVSERPQRHNSRTTIPIRTSIKGVIHNLPKPDYGRFIARPELEEDVLTKLAHPRLFITTLDGIGGSGKTALALDVATRISERTAGDNVNLHFDYIVWVSAKNSTLAIDGIHKNTPPFTSVADLAGEILRVSSMQPANRLEGDALLTEALAVLSIARFLLVIDNLETVSDVQRLWEYLLDPRFPAPTKVLVTSRHRQARAELVVNVRGLSLAQSRALVKSESERFGISDRVPLEDSHITILMNRTGALPLALKQIVGHILKGLTFEQAVARLPNDPGGILEFCFPASFDLLDKRSKKVLLSLGKARKGLPREDLELLSQIHSIDFENAIAELSSLSLVDVTGDSSSDTLYTLLPLTAAFCERKIAEYPDMEEEILAQLRNMAQLEEAAPLIGTSIAGCATSERMSYLAMGYAERSQFDRADYWFAQAVQADPRDGLAWHLKAKFEGRDKQDIVQARLSFGKAAELRPKDSLVLLDWARVEKANKHFEKALDLFTRAIRLDPTDPYGLHGRASLMLDQGIQSKEEGKRTQRMELRRVGNDKIAASVTEFSSAYFRTPKSTQERHHNAVNAYLHSKALSRLGQMPEALKVCDLGLVAEPTNGKLLSWRQLLVGWQ
jgi:tetratricopeptide (TPR) repeat protein